jgi:hypothetical protein
MLDLPSQHHLEVLLYNLVITVELLLLLLALLPVLIVEVQSLLRHTNKLVLLVSPQTPNKVDIFGAPPPPPEPQ